MNKVGIVTFTYGDNFGQRLQNFAVQEYLKSLGFEPYTIKVKGLYEDNITRFKQFIQNRYSISNIVSCLNRTKRFDEFNKQYIRFYNTKSSKEFSAKKFNDYDLFIAGSDQVWNPNSPAVNHNYFLTFVPREKRMSFAASFSVDEIPDGKIQEYKNYINGIDYLTVRENSGVKIINKICGKQALLVCDPTLLFNGEWWGKLERRPKKQFTNKYILKYFLGQTTNNESIEIFAKENGLEIIDLGLKNGFYDIDPAEFVYMIHHAKYVFTDSYHGMLFSMQFNKPFRNFNRVDSNVSMNSRFETVFSVLNVKQENIRSSDLDSMLNYEEISKELEKFRERSKGILNECILGIIGK